MTLLERLSIVFAIFIGCVINTACEVTAPIQIVGGCLTADLVGKRSNSEPFSVVCDVHRAVTLIAVPPLPVVPEQLISAGLSLRASEALLEVRIPGSKWCVVQRTPPKDPVAEDGWLAECVKSNAQIADVIVRTGRSFRFTLRRDDAGVHLVSLNVVTQ